MTYSLRDLHAILNKTHNNLNTFKRLVWLVPLAQTLGQTWLVPSIVFEKN